MTPPDPSYMNATLSALRQKKRLPTGIAGFDHISRGGLVAGRTTLIAGSSGSGKTLFSLEILYRQITQFDASALFVTMEEKTEDIIANVEEMGWNLFKYVEAGKLDFIDASPDNTPTRNIGDINLDGLLAQIKGALEECGAKFLILDSIGVLFSQFADSTVVRREIGKIIQYLKEIKVTCLMTVERTEEYGQISRLGVEEFVSDNVIILRQILEQERIRRTLQIMKMRGTSYKSGEFPFNMTEQGFSLIPLSDMDQIQPLSDVRISSGNAKLDTIMEGGVFQDSTILLSGPSGGGKTLMGLTFIAEACRNGKKAVLLAYEEPRPQLVRTAQAWGMDFRKWEEDGLLQVICIYPEAAPLEYHLLYIQKIIHEFRPERLVMDSISAMERIANHRMFREFIIAMTSLCKLQQVSSLFTCTTPQLTGGSSPTEVLVATITDVIILIRYIEIHGILRRGIGVIKMRGSQHDKQVYEFTIDTGGLNIGVPFKNVQNIMLGMPTATAPSEVERLEALFSQERGG